MPKSQRMTMPDLEAECVRRNGVIENDPELNMSFLMVAGREVAYAVTDTTVPGVSSR